MPFWKAVAGIAAGVFSVKFIAVVGGVIIAKTAIAQFSDSAKETLGSARVELGQLKLEVSDFGFEGTTEGEANKPFGIARGMQVGGGVARFSLDNNCIPTSITICLEPEMITMMGEPAMIRAIISPEDSYSFSLEANPDGGSAKAFGNFTFGITNPNNIVDGNLSTFVTNPLFNFSDEISDGSKTTVISETTIDFPISEGEDLYLGFTASIGGEAIITTTEFSSNLSLLTFGTLGAASIFKRKLKSFKSLKKQIEKV